MQWIPCSSTVVVQSMWMPLSPQKATPSTAVLIVLKDGLETFSSRPHQKSGSFFLRHLAKPLLVAYFVGVRLSASGVQRSGDEELAERLKAFIMHLRGKDPQFATQDAMDKALEQGLFSTAAKVHKSMQLSLEHCPRPSRFACGFAVLMSRDYFFPGAVICSRRTKEYLFSWRACPSLRSIVGRVASPASDRPSLVRFATQHHPDTCG